MPGQNLPTKMSRQDLRKLADFREMAEAHIERLGQAIQSRRKAMGWSRARLGREVDAHEKTVERWEKAQTAGALDNIEAIARALDVDRDALLAQAIPPRKPGPTPDPFAGAIPPDPEVLKVLATLGERIAEVAAGVENLERQVEALARRLPPEEESEAQE